MKAALTRTITLAAASLTLAAAAHAGPFDTVDLTPETVLSGFEKVYIAPVEVNLGDRPTRRFVRDINRARPVSDRDQARKAEDLAEDLEREFGRKFTLVDTPGQDVLTIETTLTDLVSTRPTLADFNSGAVNLSFGSVYVGGAEYLVTLRQGDTLIGTIEDDQTARSNLNDGQPRTGIWQDADRSFSRFSRQLVRFTQKN